MKTFSTLHFAAFSAPLLASSLPTAPASSFEPLVGPPLLLRESIRSGEFPSPEIAPPPARPILHRDQLRRSAPRSPMLVLPPDPRIDYTLRIGTPDPTIDYKLLIGIPPAR